MADKLGVQRGRAWHTERGKHAYRNKREPWEYGRRGKRKTVTVDAHTRRTKAGKLVHVDRYTRKR